MELVFQLIPFPVCCLAGEYEVYEGKSLSPESADVTFTQTNGPAIHHSLRDHTAVKQIPCWYEQLMAGICRGSHL